MLIKNFFLGFFLFASLSACAPTPTPPQTRTLVVTQPKAKIVEVPNINVSWSLDIPADWSKEIRPNPTKLYDVRKVLKATKTVSIGNKKAYAILNVIVGHMSKEQSDNFPKDIVDAELNRDNTKVIDTKAVLLGSVPGVEIIEMRQFDSKELAVFLIRAGALNNFGVAATCGTAVETADDVLPECEKILNTLVVK